MNRVDLKRRKYAREKPRLEAPKPNAEMYTVTEFVMTK